MGKSIENLKLSRRASNALYRMNVKNVEQLLGLSMEQLMRQRNIGTKALDEIMEIIDNITAGNGKLDCHESLDYISAQNTKNRFSKDEIEELSHHLLAELGLSNRAYNALFKIECITMDKLVQMPKMEIRSLNGLGEKTCNEIFDKLSQWLDSNMPYVGKHDIDDMISEKEKQFFKEIAAKISPIKQIYWTILRKLIINSDSIQITSYDLNKVDECIGELLCLQEFESHIKDFFLSIASEGIIMCDKLKECLSSMDLDFDSSMIWKAICNGSSFSEEWGCIYIKRPTMAQYVLQQETGKGDRNTKILISRLRGRKITGLGKCTWIDQRRSETSCKKCCRKTATDV